MRKVNLDWNSQRNSKENFIFETIKALTEKKLLGYEINNLDEEIRPDVTIEQFQLTKQTIELYQKGPKYFYGIIYKITEKSTNKVRIGQALSSFQARWNTYKSSAKNDINRLSEDPRSFERLLRKYMDLGLDIDKVGPGINNEYFEVEILAIVPHHEDSQISQAILNDLEAFYVNKFRANNKYFGYNILPGGDQARFLAKETLKKPEPSNIEILQAIDDSIFNSLTKAEVANSFGVSENTLERWIEDKFKVKENELWVKRTYSEIRFERLTEILIPYLKQGYSPAQLSKIFNVAPSTITNWIKQIYNGKNWQQIMVDIMPKLIKEKIGKGHINYNELAQDFPGIPGRNKKIENFINKYIDDLTKVQLQYYQKQVGIDLIKDGKTAKYILMQLGYSLDILKSDTMINKKFSEFFDGMTYEEAKLFYITNNLKNPINQKS